MSVNLYWIDHIVELEPFLVNQKTSVQTILLSRAKNNND